jgi:hypothetical protein
VRIIRVFCFRKPDKVASEVLHRRIGAWGLDSVKNQPQWHLSSRPAALLLNVWISSILRVFSRLPAVRRDPPRGYDGGAPMPQDDLQDQPLGVLPSATTSEALNVAGSDGVAPPLGDMSAEGFRHYGRSVVD